MSNIPSGTASVDDVKRIVAQAFNSVKARDDDRGDANKVLAEASQSATNEREAQLVKIATVSREQSWDGTLTEMGVDAAKAARNNQKDNSINTFANELKRACHPTVRGTIGDMFALAGEAWDAEKDADDKPLRAAFKRKYHLVVGAMFNAAISGAPMTEPEQLVEAALNVIRERERDYTMVAKRLKAIRDQLDKFAQDFPLDGITACVEFLDEIKVEDLRECVKPSSPKVAAPAVQPKAAEPETVEGASDILAEINSDLSRLAA